MENFTPVSALIGGVLIGLAATMLLWMNGRIAGIAGIVGGTLPPQRGDLVWRLMFIAGLVLGALAYRMVAGAEAAPVHLDATLPVLIAGGLLVGFGTRLGSGCTSGHGVCGIARLSPRSISATVTFMLAGAITVYVMRHVIGG